MRRSFSHLVASICLLAVWIATPLLSVAHLAIEEHSYCAEHERLEEGSHAHVDLGKDTERSASAVWRPASESPQESQGEHEGCAFAEEFTRDCQVLALHEPGDSPALATEPTACSAPTEVRTNDLLLRVAPKNSPPHLA